MMPWVYITLVVEYEVILTVTPVEIQTYTIIDCVYYAQKGYYTFIVLSNKPYFRGFLKGRGEGYTFKLVKNVFTCVCVLGACIIAFTRK